MSAKANSALALQCRAALYLRVSTGRQAGHDLSIPDQRRELQAYCEAKGIEVVAEFVEPGASATDDRRPEFQRMMDAASQKLPMFDTIIVHSFSRFFRDQFQLEFYVRRLAKNGIRLTSITQDLGDDPMSVMMRQIMTLFDEYQSKENAKHDCWRQTALRTCWLDCLNVARNMLRVKKLALPTLRSRPPTPRPSSPGYTRRLRTAWPTWTTPTSRGGLRN